MGGIQKALANSYLSLGLLAVATIFVFFRFLPTLPTVMQDEYVYLVQTGLQPISENEFGNFLHTFIYASIFLFGDGFYLAAKVINVFWLFSFSVSVWLTARLYLEHWVATIIALATALSATGLYASVLMPEMMFFALASWSIYFFALAIQPEQKRPWLMFSVSVLFLTLAGLTKPHAIILTAGLVGFLIISVFLKREAFRKSLLRMGLVTFGYVGLKLALGFALAGTQGLTILGASYERSLISFLNQISAFNQGAMSASALVINPVDAQGFSNFFLFTITHLALLIFGFAFMTLGFPMLLIRPLSKLSDFQLLVIVISVVYLVGIAMFTALVTFTGDNHADRLLGRYFEFLIPLVFIAGLIELFRREKVLLPRKILFAVSILVFAIVWIAIISQADFKLSDSATLLGAFRQELLPWLVIAFVAVLALLIIDRPKQLKPIAATALLLTVVLTGLSSQQRQIELNSGKVSADFAGDALRNNHSEIPGDQVVVLGTNKQLAFVTKFWSVKKDVDHFVLNPESIVSANDPQLANYTLIVELAGIQVNDGYELTKGEGFRILGKQ